MLIWLVDLADKVQFFNLFRYITFRTGAAMFTAALIVFLFGPRIIASLKVRQGRGQPIAVVGGPIERLRGYHAPGDARLRRHRLL